MRWSGTPHPGPCVLIIAFDGWNDAGEAASSTIEWMIDRWDTTPLADIDPEEFYDFTAQRPIATFDDDRNRVINWPSNEFHHGTLGDTERRVVLMKGTEPGLKWRTFIEEILAVADEVGADLMITAGALIAEVSHSRAVHVVGSATSEELTERHDLARSTYEGPTGIVGVLHDSARTKGLDSVSMWATVPTYVSGARSPKAQLALVERIAHMLDLSVMTTDLEIATAAYERQVQELVDADADTLSYVAELEARHDQAMADSELDDLDEEDDEAEITTAPADIDQMMTEVEKFLRDEN